MLRRPHCILVLVNICVVDVVSLFAIEDCLQIGMWGGWWAILTGNLVNMSRLYWMCLIRHWHRRRPCPDSTPEID